MLVAGACFITPEKNTTINFQALNTFNNIMNLIQLRFDES